MIFAAPDVCKLRPKHEASTVGTANMHINNGGKDLDIQRTLQISHSNTGAARRGPLQILSEIAKMASP